MRLVVEVEGHEYDAAVSRAVHFVRITELEVRQADGVLSTLRKVLHVDALGMPKKAELGIAQGSPVIVVFTDGGEEKVA